MNIETANRLAEMRRERGLSQEELAERLGISRQAVSKWERAEASPDTDNLLALAKLYGVSLDSLLGHVPDERPAQDGPAPEGESTPRDGGTRVSFRDGITVEDGRDKVHIAPGAIAVDDERDSVRIDRDGVTVNGRRYTKQELLKKHGHDGEHDRVFGAAAVLCTAFYLVAGAVWNLWHPAWLVFFLVPIIGSAAEAAAHRDISRFCFPVLAVLVYLIMGFWKNLWHPGWVVFLLIPVFYMLVPEKRKAVENEDEDE